MVEKKKEEAVPAVPATEPAPATPAKKSSLVDTAFDKLTAWAAQSLEAAKRGLETSARWLDARAKRVGEVATKLAPPPRATTE